ncbi:MAG TPA: 3-deoxy-D-manno-octulosonic acid transferase [Burkholderiales bacterium]
MRALYTALLRLALPFILLRLWWRGRREPRYRDAVGERFGRYRVPAKPGLVWIHAVSVGEARAAAPLVRALSDRPVLVTCTTAAGRETLEQVYGDAVLAAYLPYDYPEAVERFLRHFRPALGILMETEVWPNLLLACKASGIPVVLANARMSAKSARGYARWAGLTRPAFASLAAVCAQSTADAERLRALGARNVEVTGNLKFDAHPDAEQIAAGQAWRARLHRPVLLLASTREGEEKLLLEEPTPAAVLVVVVPRHPQRFDEVAALADSRRTQQPVPRPGERVHLGDTMGELAFYYGACDVAVIGGGFAPLGGQNLIEALACGAPVVLGPHMFNFAEATRLALDAGAAVQAADARSAMRAALALLADQARRQKMSAAGRKLCETHRGATAHHLAVCRRLLAQKGSEQFS